MKKKRVQFKVALDEEETQLLLEKIKKLKCNSFAHMIRVIIGRPTTRKYRLDLCGTSNKVPQTSPTETTDTNEVPH